jgi:hypothetical protein
MNVKYAGMVNNLFWYVKQGEEGAGILCGNSSP